MVIPSIISFVKRSISKYKFPFRWKIIVPFLLLGLWLVIGGAYIVSRIVFENSAERFNNQLIEAGKISAEWMVKEEKDQLEALRFLAFTTGVADALRARDAEQLRSLTFTIALNKQLEAVEFLDISGNLIFSMRHQPGAVIEDYNFVRDGSDYFGTYAFVQKTLQAQIDRRGDKYAGLVKPDREEYFYIAAPLFDDQDTYIGSILVGTSLRTLIAHFRDQTYARITLYRPDGAVVLSSFSGIDGLDPSQAALILNPQVPNSFTRTNRILETDFTELIIPWRARGQELGVLGVSFSKPLFTNPSIPTRLGMFGFVLAIFVFIILLGLFIANALTRPLANLTRASHEVSRGNLKIQVPDPLLNDEITDLTRTFNHMVTSLNEANHEVLQTYDTTLVGWGLALELREKQAALHNQRVAVLAVRMARLVGIQGEDLENVRYGALLHDIGKMGVPESILNKPGPLTDLEIAEMKLHPVYAQQILSQINYLRPAMIIPFYHHEKWNGTGYPSGLSGEDIPLTARLFALVDVWDAITFDRVYRKAMTRNEAILVIKNGKGSYFDPHLTDIFLESLSQIDPEKPESPESQDESLNVGVEIG